MHSRILILRRLGLFALAAAGVYLLLSAVGGVVLMESALHPPRRPVAQQSGFALAKWAPSGVANVEIEGADGAELKGWYAQPPAWNGDSVILLHGVGDNREGVTSYAAMFLRSGYAVLLPDSRAQGESGGQIGTYGLLESQDVQRWSRWIANRAGSDVRAPCTYFFGESMGAAIALESTAAQPEVCAVVAEAPFSSFREIGYERIAQGLGSSVGFSHIFALPMVNSAFLYARLRYGLDFDQASPEQKLAASHVPALLIAGLDDRNIPARHSVQIARLAGGQTQLWLVAGAGHTSAASVDSAAFERRVIGWFAAHPRKAS
jgi:alpha-beta hydrolase superfamily lysophospholipase